jgi:TRAP-type mannitol/chloroaromatic compound transport system substrate-binding protein
MSKNKMLELSNQNNYSDLYNDARTDSDRHVYKILFGEERIYDKLSPDAKLVLDKATELVTKSMQMREIFANDENHLKSWDAGYAQLKLIWKEYYADEFKEFRQLYKNLEDRMRPLVYEIGFLLK